jgi:hypothetical protein
MKTGRLFGLLLACALVVAVAYIYYHRTHRFIPIVHEVDIVDDCQVVPPSLDVYEDHKIKWCNKGGATNYQIDFDGKSPIPHVSGFPADCSPRPIKRDSDCNSNPHDYNGKCYYKYSVTRSGDSTPCVDPGVHIVPGG